MSFCGPGYPLACGSGVNLAGGEFAHFTQSHPDRKGGAPGTGATLAPQDLVNRVCARQHPLPLGVLGALARAGVFAFAGGRDDLG